MKRTLCLSLVLLVTGTLGASEIVTVNVGGMPLRGEVVKAGKTEVVLKTTDGHLQTVPGKLLKPKEIFACWRMTLAPDDAKGHFELGEYGMQNGLKQDADTELKLALRLDAKSYKEKVEALLAAANPATPPTPPAPPTPPPATKTSTTSKAEPPKETTSSTSSDGKDGEEEMIEVVMGGRKVLIPKRFAGGSIEVKPKSDAEIKKFNEDRLEELKRVCGGEWRVEELAHFYQFSNLPLALHNEFKVKDENLYKILCTVMQHKDGERLWNNKCPIYYFAKRSQFQTFAVQIDHAPGGANSGGYFSPHGREVHIAIPMYDTMGQANAVREASNTLYHEGTHAFLQLVGEDVPLNRWLHEGMAQFIEFYYDPKNNSGRNDRVSLLRDRIRNGDILSWEAGCQRPMGGTDHDGYAFAWSRIHFLYNSFPDHTMLPKMIHLIKSGKSETEAMETVYGHKVSELESAWEGWMKIASKNNFN